MDVSVLLYAWIIESLKKEKNNLSKTALYSSSENAELLETDYMEIDSEDRRNH